jgi:hypothetical protein
LVNHVKRGKLFFVSRKRKIIFSLIILFFVFIALAIIILFKFILHRKAAILIETTPASQVFIDGEGLGKTPYEGEFNEKEIAIKLIPDSFEKPLVPFETKLKLTSGVKTIVRRTFGELEGDSSGEEISFEKLRGSETSISIVSTPDAAKVFLNDQFKDVTPLKISDIASGTYQISLKADNYEDRSFSVQTYPGYGVTAVVELAKKSGEETKKSEESPSPTEVKILETPTGFLRVREEPNKDSAELGQVDPGKTYKFLDKDKDSGWYKIEFDDGKSGWVSNDYATASAEVKP